MPSTSAAKPSPKAALNFFSRNCLSSAPSCSVGTTSLSPALSAPMDSMRSGTSMRSG